MQWPVGSKGHRGSSAAESSATFEESGKKWEQALPRLPDQSCIRPASHQAPHTNGHYRHTPWSTWTSERNNLRGAIENEKAYP